MKGYIQEFDTVNFNEDKIFADRVGVYDDARVKSAIYNLFYDVTLSPNQVLDLRWLRDSLSSSYNPRSNPKNWPYIFTVLKPFGRSTTPFTDQLVYLLKRRGKDAFVFSSIQNNIELQEEWGKLVSRRGREMSGTALLREARKYCEDIVDWAKELDKARHQIKIHAYDPVISFSDLYKLLSTFSNEPYGTPPDTRSAAYSEIDSRPKELGIDPKLFTIDIQKAKDKPDLVSNLQYAICTDARFTRDPKKPLPFELFNLPISRPTAIKRHLVIDFQMLFKDYQEIKPAILSSSPEELSRATFEAKDYIRRGWSFLDDNLDKQARLEFGEGLRQFLTRLLERGFPKIPLEVSTDPNRPNVSIDILVPLVSFLVKKYKWRKGGLDHFINFP